MITSAKKVEYLCGYPCINLVRGHFALLKSRTPNQDQIDGAMDKTTGLYKGSSLSPGPDFKNQPTESKKELPYLANSVIQSHEAPIARRKDN